MMNVVLRDSITFFFYALVAIFAQNAVFARGLGVSRLVHLVEDDALNNQIFGVHLFCLQALCAPLAYFINLYLAPFGYRGMVQPLAYILCIALVAGVLFGLVALFGQKFGAEKTARWKQLLPLAAFHSGLMGTLLIATKQDYTLLQSVAFGIGSGLGYNIAVMIVSEAQRKLRNRNVPEAFRGLPITLLYIGILSLAIYAFTGHTVTI